MRPLDAEAGVRDLGLELGHSAGSGLCQDVGHNHQRQTQQQVQHSPGPGGHHLIGYDQMASVHQQAVTLAQNESLLVLRQLAEGEAAHDGVEASGLELLVQLDGAHLHQGNAVLHLRLFHLLAGDVQHEGRDVDARDLSAAAGADQGQQAGAAADVQHAGAIARSVFRHLPVDAVDPSQREEPDPEIVAAGRRLK